MKYREIRERLFRASHELHRVRMQRMFPDVSKQEFIAMSIISREAQEGKRMTVSALAQRMKCAAPTISRLLRGAETKGLVMRRSDGGDRRNTYLSLTEYGEKRYHEVLEIMDSFTDAVLERIGLKRTEAILAYMEEIADIMEDEICRREGGKK